jgi:Dehydrogenase E1 component
MTAAEDLPVIARFEVRRRSYLAPDGSVLRSLPDFASNTGLLLRAMALLRAFDLKAVALQRTGRLGTYPVSLGQEAVSVGIASAMSEDDVLVPSYRDTGALIWRGVKMEEILLYWGGDERGSRSSGPAHDFPICAPVGSQAPHAAGIAYAFRLRKEPRVAVCVCGDGATSKGDLWEAMNFAGVWKLPVVFVVTNNHGSLEEAFAKELMLARRVHAENKNLRPVKGAPAGADLRVFSLHAPEVECIGKGKAHRPYEFGVKVSVATTLCHSKGGQFIVHAKALPGKPYDGHTLGTVILRETDWRLA